MRLCSSALSRTLLFFAIVTCSLAQQSAAGGGLQRKVDSIFSQYNHTSTPGCAVGATRNGSTVVSSGYGMADLEHGLAITPDTIFEAGSVSKQFTAAAVLLLAQQGKLSVDDYARKYIPELTDAASTVTIRNMLNHTAGLRDWGSLAAIAGWPRTTRAHTHAHVLEIVSRQKALNYAPGAAYSYSNTGYNLAAILVSRVAGKPLAQYTRESVFTPLRMASTLWRDNFKQVVRGRAVAYAASGDTFEMDMPFEDVHGNGGLLTTVGDLLRWNGNFTDPKVGGAPLLEAQLQQAKLTDGRTIAYAAGLRIGQWRGVKEVSHSGATAGYRAWLARYPEQQLSVAVLCNVASANAPLLGHQVAGLFLPAVELPAPIVVEPALLQSKAGLYRSLRDSSTILVTYDGGRLTLGSRGTLRPVAAGTFLSSDGGLHVVFKGGHMSVGLPDDDSVLFERVEPVKAVADLESYPGAYVSEEAETTLRVAVEGDHLVVHRRPDAKLPLTPTYRDAFDSPSLGSVRFVRNARGAVTEMIVGQDRVWNLSFRRLP